MSVFKASILKFTNTYISFTFIIIFTHNAIAQPSTQSGLLQFVRTVQVTPDSNFLIGGFVRVGYIPANNRLAVVFGTKFTQPFEGSEKGHAYKEYDLDMQATGKSGALNGEVGDRGGLMVGNDYFDVSQQKDGDTVGWRIIKYDAVTWTTLANIFFPLDAPREGDGDPMVAFVNGQLDISSAYSTYGGPPPPSEGASTHHEFFSLDLKFIGKKILTDTPHVHTSSLIFVDSMYYFITPTAYTGDVILMKYDKDWKFLGTKKLRDQAHMSTGVAFDGLRFYVAYLNTSQRTEPGFFPYYPNVHLAAFDREWNLIEDVAVTNYPPSAYRAPGRPWVLMYNSRLYVSYDQTVNDSITHEDNLDSIEAYVSIYDLNPNSTSVAQSNLLPMRFQLEQNYPNPFNPSTTIQYNLPSAAYVRLSVYDILGREVNVPVNQLMPAGHHDVVFHANNLACGIYFYRIKAGSYVQTRKMILLK